MMSDEPYEAALELVRDRLGPNYLPLVIAIDGEDGSGKTTFSNWLGWRLGLPVYHLDLFLSDGQGVSWRVDDLRRALMTRWMDKPLIIEGICVLDTIRKAIPSGVADVHVWIQNREKEPLPYRYPSTHHMRIPQDAYQANYRPSLTCDIQIVFGEPVDLTHCILADDFDVNPATRDAFLRLL